MKAAAVTVAGGQVTWQTVVAGAWGVPRGAGDPAAAVTGVDSGVAAVVAVAGAGTVAGGVGREGRAGVGESLCDRSGCVTQQVPAG